MGVFLEDRPESATVDLDPRIQHALDHHLSGEKYALYREVLEGLAKQTKPTTSRELMAVLGVSHFAPHRLFGQLVRLTEAYEKQFGFKVAFIQKASTYYYHIEYTGAGERTDVQLKTRARSADLLEVTDEMIAKVQKNLPADTRDISLSSGQGQDKSAIVESARWLFRGANYPDLAIAHALESAGREGYTRHSKSLRVEFDLPHAARNKIAQMEYRGFEYALEAGCLVVAVKRGFYTVLFLDPAQREERLLIGSKADPQFLDVVKPFSKAAFARRLKRAEAQGLFTPNEVAIAKKVNNAYGRKSPIKPKVLCDQLGIVPSTVLHRTRAIQSKRHETGISVRKRIDRTLEPVVLDEEAMASVYDSTIR